MNASTGVISGTPTVASTYSFTVTATDAVSDTGSQPYSVTVISVTPTLVSISPTSGTTAGGTSVTLTGTNLTGTSSVTFAGIAATGVVVDSSTSVTAVTPADTTGAVDVVITTPGGTATLTLGYTYGIIGSSFGGGTVACLGGEPYMNLVAATADNSSGIQWYNGSNITTNATSSTNGAANTVSIVTTQGAGSYAATVCTSYSGGSYNDWFLPAEDQLNCLSNNKTAIGGFGATYYWSSTETNSTSAFAWNFNTNVSVNASKFSVVPNVRCVRNF